MKIPEITTPSDEKNVSGGKLNRFRLDEFGRELVDSRPMEPPVGYQKRESVTEQIRRMIHQASAEAASAGAETEAEANDFYIADDPGSELPPTNYEFDEDYELEQQLARQKAAQIAEDGPEPPDPVPVPPTSSGKKKPSKAPPEPLGGSGEDE